MLKDHPTEDIQCQLSSRLKGKKIVLGISGSVAAVRCCDLARLLIRHGADVIPVMSEAACKIIHPELMEWSTGNETITALSGKVEHVMHCGNVPNKADLLLIYPSTANTLSKIACGIDDSPVTTFATTAIGEGIPVLVVPAMHLPMYHHPAVKRNMKQLEADGIQLVSPHISEGKAKAAGPEEVLDAVFKLFSEIQSDLESGPTIEGLLTGRKVVITGGRTVEPIDPFRVITNRSSGKMAAALARAAINAGADVTLITGAHNVSYPQEASIIETETTRQMLDAVEKSLKPYQSGGNHSEDQPLFIGCAAVSDWMPEAVSDKKIPTSGGKLELTLIPTPKIIDRVRELAPGATLVAFRALSSLNDKEMIQNGFQRLQQAGADLICVNDVGRPDSGFDSDNNRILLVDSEQNSSVIGPSPKSDCAVEIIRAAALLKCPE